MKFKFLIILFFPFTSYACLNATLHKTFPVGIVDGKIIVINTHIFRGGDFDRDDDGIFRYDWQIKTQVSAYSNGELLSAEDIGTIKFRAENYSNQLHTLYIKGLEVVSNKFEAISYFKLDYFSFCEYKKKCERLSYESVKNNSIHQLVFNSHSYELNKKRLNELVNFESSFTQSLSGYYLSSIRIYSSHNIRLVVGHLQSGHQLSMGWITDDPNKKPKDEFDTVIYKKEYQPKLKLNVKDNGIYEEPLLHHGFGFDYFFQVK